MCNDIMNKDMKEITLEELYDGDFYHVCTEGLETEVIMRDDEDFIVARNYLALSAWKTKVFIVAFCLMSNHLHTLVGAKNRKDVLDFIRHFKQIYSTYLRNKYGLGHALKGHPECIVAISDIKYLRNCIAYILRNAVSAKICRKIEEYPWSSYNAYFTTDSNTSRLPITSLKGRLRKKLLKTRMNLDDCPYRIDEQGSISVDSFVRTDLVHLIFNRSGRSFLYYLGSCNDAQMEYELASRPLVQANDHDLLSSAEKVAAQRFKGKNIAMLTTGEKCSIIKYLFFNHKSTIPQLSRILGLPRELVRKVLSS
jgi:REP element-mobilizing transposase RayT